jgi:iron complex outermembrane receptor protein
MGFGKVTLTAGYNYNKTQIIDRAILPSIAGVPLFGRTESFRLTDAQPRSKVSLSGDFDFGPVGLTLRANRYGRVLSAANTGGTVSPAGAVTLAAFGTQAGDLELEPRWITDIELRAHPIERVTVAIGADNVFDQYPTRLPIANTANGFTPNSFFLPYSSLSPFGFNGRYLYGRVAFDF